ncbi:DNA repair protein RecO [Octadecabacter antarcticus 307]|uniref:DNA repair protein RecO n=1 Tax=Octadecabacter antarcticus 307 TaxID=391626 RepID=M9R0C6_9RHOB|nr:DNA repair protein RecO [Octadecabacter antarcticus]AGI66064.1 DNA repair protein RecO [Octadecabacter antarcticus 307]
MIEWRDEGALVRVRKHGESSAIIEVFTASRGLTAGIVRGGTSRKIAPTLQPGAQLDVTWKARLEDHLGSFTVEPIRSRTAQVMQDRLALAGLNAVTGLLSFLLPDREAHAPLYARTIQLLDLLGQNDVWPLAYLQWEVALLDEMGFGMDLSACAVSGLNDDLFYVSPRTGRAVSRLAAGEWADRLLPLPHVLLGKGDADLNEIVLALRTTGHFLNNHLAKSLGDRPIPEARQRLIDAMKRLA